jgi:hypothetical protein
MEDLRETERNRESERNREKQRESSSTRDMKKQNTQIHHVETIETLSSAENHHVQEKPSHIHELSSLLASRGNAGAEVAGMRHRGAIKRGK